MTLSSAERVHAVPVAESGPPRRGRRSGLAPALVTPIGPGVACSSPQPGLALFLVSLYPRIINTGGYLTTDEGNWMGRTALFTRALVEVTRPGPTRVATRA